MPAYKTSLSGPAAKGRDGNDGGAAVFNAGVAAGNVQPYFITQAVSDLDGSKTLDQQPELPTIRDQALQAAGAFSAFIAAATTTLDIAIYDFRLLPGPLEDEFLGAIRAAAQRGVSVRLAYDKTAESSEETGLKDFSGAGGDPAPVGTHTFLARAQLPPASRCARSPRRPSTRAPRSCTTSTSSATRAPRRRRC